jgi:protein-disulfide isomerase
MWLDSKGGKSIEPLINDYFEVWKVAPAVSFNSEGITKGPKQSIMSIVEFADFKCPHCKSAAPSLKAFSASHPEVSITFKAFPLDGNCNANPQMPTSDGISCKLAKAVYCGEKLSQKGWQLYEDFFVSQEILRNPSDYNLEFSKIVTKNRLNESELQTCINNEETHKAIINQSQEGINAQIEGTPTIFVNGKKLKLGHMVTMLEKVFAFLIADKK